MSANMDIPDQGKATEVPLRPKRRSFSAKDKLRIIQGAEACAEGQLGAFLRREGIYSTQLSDWRRKYRKHGLEGLQSKRNQPREDDGTQGRISELEAENRKLRRRAQRAEALVQLQKKISQLLGISLPESGEDNS